MARVSGWWGHGDPALTEVYVQQESPAEPAASDSPVMGSRHCDNVCSAYKFLSILLSFRFSLSGIRDK